MKPASILAGYIALTLWILAITSTFTAIWLVDNPTLTEKTWATAAYSFLFATVLTLIWKFLPHSYYGKHRH
jgi:hypothetical protein